jgi:hypothetical protein
MNGETGFCIASASSGSCVREDPRGARQWGIFVPQTCMRQDRLILTMMQHAHRRRSSGRRAHSRGRHQVPCSNTASRHLGSSSAVVLKSQRAPSGAECYARSGKPFQDAGRKTTPSSNSPVVTKRQSAMISLRASATIMVLRVPVRLSAVRARYHRASALSF